MTEGNAPIFLDTEQRSDGWRSKRLGRPSASQFHRVVTAKGNRAEKSANTYKWQLLAERIFSVSFAPNIDRIPAVRHGRNFEEMARLALGDFLKVPIRPGGIVMTRDERMVASPDGWIGDNPVEIKCPLLPGHLENLLIDPRDHWPQIQGQMMIAQTDWAHFWSFHPCAPARHIRVYRDSPFCNTLNYELRRFCDELDRDEAELRSLGEYDPELYLAMIKPKEREEESQTEGETP